MAEPTPIETAASKPPPRVIAELTPLEDAEAERAGLTRRGAEPLRNKTKLMQREDVEAELPRKRAKMEQRLREDREAEKPWKTAELTPYEDEEAHPPRKRTESTATGIEIPIARLHEER